MSPKPGYRRILIVKPSSIGDVVHSLPVLAKLRANFPKSHIAWLVARKALDIIEDNPYLNEVFVFERERWGRLRDLPRAWGEFVGLIREIRARRFDLVIDLQGLFRSGLLSWASGATLRIGFENGREMSRFFYNRRVRVPLDMHSVNRYLTLMEGLGVKGGSPEFEINFPEEASRRVWDLLKDNGLSQGSILVVFAPGARWLTKRWGGKRYALLAQALKEKYQARVVLVGAAEEVPLIRDIEREGGFKMANLAGKINLKELAALLEMADLCVANDTAPLHLAAALNTPTVAIFGPTAPARTGPFSQLHRVVYAGVSCSPCFSRKCSEMRCLDAIGVEDVMERIENLAREMKWPIS